MPYNGHILLCSICGITLIIANAKTSESTNIDENQKELLEDLNINSNDVVSTDKI